MMDSGANGMAKEIECPLCTGHFPSSVINAHVDECLNKTNLDDEEGFKEQTISEDPLSNITPQSTIQCSFDATGRDNFHSLPVDAAPSDSKQKVESSHISTGDSPKNKWSFLKSTNAVSSGRMTFGQTGKKIIPRNSNSGNLTATNSPNLRKTSFDSAPEQRSERVTSGNFKRMKLQSSEVVRSTNVALGDFQTSSLGSEKTGKTAPLGNPRSAVAPLAETVRPASFDEFVGQDVTFGSRTLLRRLLESDTFPSMILWGPPGCGKTTVARIVASRCRNLSSWRFVQLSATMSGIADIKEAIQIAKNEKSSFKRRTVLFIDEIHRFNKLQQDTFLPHVEDGTIILIGATTENPSFTVNTALLSRCKVIVLEKLSAENVEKILRRALSEINVGVLFPADNDAANRAPRDSGAFRLFVESAVVNLISQMCDGDARCALNCLENLVDSKSSVDSIDVAVVTVEDAREALVRSHVQYDRTGEEHYNCASALQKSIRGSSEDGAIYWLARMLEGGEDPLFIARRLVVCSSEDIGLADAHALPLAVSTFQACHFLGMPECALNLAHCTTYLARAPKSNEAYAALGRARENIRRHAGPLPGVPLHLRNAPTKLMKDLGYHKGYQYNHDIQGPVNQEYLPEQLLSTSFFSTPS